MKRLLIGSVCLALIPTLALGAPPASQPTTSTYPDRPKSTEATCKAKGPGYVWATTKKDGTPRKKAVCMKVKPSSA